MRITGESLMRTAFVACLAIAGCSGSGTQSTSSSQSSSAGATSGGVAEGSSSTGGATQGAGTSTGASSSSGGSTSGGASTSGGTSGGITFADGGYVSCSLPFAPYAGPEGGGGPAHWVCQPGTYTCDVSGNIGQCFQCQSDHDCANPELPTYDPKRPHCDVSSGVSGYQNFCQECVANSDCSTSSEGKYCDLNPAFPIGSSQPPIVNLGFEHCGKVLTDCRIDGGPPCAGNNQFCDPTNGVCATHPGTCVDDKDCAGLISPYNPYLPEPFCVNGACNSCADGHCPTGFCQSDADCGNPSSLPSGLICDPATDQCSCTDSSQCSGFWPACELDPKRVDDAGQTLGTCGCDATDQCGDAGFICLPPNPLSGSTATSCGIPCTDPEFQACRTSTYFYPVCDPATGACGPCKLDSQCRAGVNTGGPFCDFGSGGMGNCGCIIDSDCPIGESCQSGQFLGTCAASLDRCSPGSCGSYFCDWDAGTCLNNINSSSFPSCITDYDCAATGYSNADPICDNGRCIQCLSSSDCLANGEAASSGYSVCCTAGNPACAGLPANSCEGVCNNDQDCVGSSQGPACNAGDSGYPPRCGCSTDLECKGAPFGRHCDRTPSDYNFGSCNCLSNSDCAPGATCDIYAPDTPGYCSSFCYGGDAGYPCPANYDCDPTYNCRPRCDNDNTCQGVDVACDTGNAGGMNGKTSQGDSGVIWCFKCATASDCAPGQGCNPLTGCGGCLTSANCPAETACVDGGILPADVRQGSLSERRDLRHLRRWWVRSERVLRVPDSRGLPQW